MEMMLRHIRMILDTDPTGRETRRMQEARKHAAWYLKGLKGAARFRGRCYSLNTYAEAEQLARDVIRLQAEGE